VVTVKPWKKERWAGLGSFSYRYLFYEVNGLDFPLKLSLTPHRPIDINTLQRLLLTHTQTNYGRAICGQDTKRKKRVVCRSAQSAYLHIAPKILETMRINMISLPLGSS